MNQKGIQRYPFKKGAVSFHTAWINTEGAHFKLSIDGVNSIHSCMQLSPKIKNQKSDEFFSQFLCGIGRDGNRLDASTY